MLLVIRAGDTPGGSPAWEEVVVEPLAPNRYRIVQSPGLTQGLAAGDIFELREDGRFDVIERSGNLAIQIHARSRIDQIEEIATSEFSRIGGWLDGSAAVTRVYTVPVSSGFHAIESAIARIAQEVPEFEWYYGNVYESDWVTPLNWWLEERYSPRPSR